MNIQNSKSIPVLEDYESITQETNSILSSPTLLIKRCQEIGEHYRSIVKDLYESDIRSAIGFVKNFDEIPSILSLGTIANCNFFKTRPSDLSYLSNVTYALNCMSADESQIVWECFFYPTKQKQSMLLKSKSTFYRMKQSGAKMLVEMTNSCYEKFVLKD